MERLELINLMLNRRSIRKYTNEDISDEKLNQIIQAGLLSPSSRNLFPVEFIVVKDKEMLLQLSRAKRAGSGMLKNANCAVVVIGDSSKSDAWIEDCSLSLIYMQLMAETLGIGSCWVQCRNRVSQQERGIEFSNKSFDPVENSGDENLVIKTVAEDNAKTDNLTSDEFIKKLLSIPDNYQVEAILSLGFPLSKTEPHTLEKLKLNKIYHEKYGYK